MTAQPAPNHPEPLALVRSDHACFGCGDNNPIGLHLIFAVSDDGVVATFVPASEHQGFNDVVHGGIISTVLDEAMAWAVAAAGIWAVTGEMRVRFRRPLRVGQVTSVRARVTADRGRLIQTTSDLVSAEDNAVLATATGSFVTVDEATATDWSRRYLTASPGAKFELRRPITRSRA